MGSLEADNLEIKKLLELTNSNFETKITDLERTIKNQ
jgi:hypothetical protein